MKQLVDQAERSQSKAEKQLLLHQAGETLQPAGSSGGMDASTRSLTPTDEGLYLVSEASGFPSKFYFTIQSTHLSIPL